MVTLSKEGASMMMASFSRSGSSINSKQEKTVPASERNRLTPQSSEGLASVCAGRHWRSMGGSGTRDVNFEERNTGLGIGEFRAVHTII